MTFSFHGCGRRSTSLVQVHCVTCCETFSGYRAFDEHRQITPRSRGGDGVDRECVEPGRLFRKNGDPVLYPDRGSLGTVWRYYRPDVRQFDAIPDTRGALQTA
jgi:hypothetical protein